MTSIIVAFPVSDDADRIKRLLKKNGFDNVLACTNAAQIINLINDIDHGIVICGYKLKDMIYSDLYNYLPQGVYMLLLASEDKISQCMIENITTVSFPLKIYDLINAVNDIIIKQRKEIKATSKPKERNEKQKLLINKAKELLMKNQNMTEEQAHRYIQKISMDSGNSMVETAEMVIRLFM